MKGKVLPYHNNERSAIDWPNAQNHFGCGDQELNQVIQPAFKTFCSQDTSFDATFVNNF